MLKLKSFLAIASGVSLSCSAFSGIEIYTGFECASVPSDYMDVSNRSNTLNSIEWSEAKTVAFGSGATCKAACASANLVLFGRYLRSSNGHSLYTDKIGFMFIIK